MLKYLIRRTDITILVNNIHSGLNTGRINPSLRDSVKYLLNYALGLVACVWDIEDLSPGQTKILQWLILSFGGHSAWTNFAHVAEKSIKAATKMVETKRVGNICSAGVDKTLTELEACSTMLVESIASDAYGGPALNHEDEDYRERMKLLETNDTPVTDQERLSFRLGRALRELKKLKSILKHEGIYTQPDTRERQNGSNVEEDMYDNLSVSMPEHTGIKETNMETASLLCSLMSILKQGSEISAALKMAGIPEELDEIGRKLKDLTGKISVQAQKDQGDNVLTQGHVQMTAPANTPSTSATSSSSKINPLLQTTPIETGEATNVIVEGKDKSSKRRGENKSYSVPSPGVSCAGLSPTDSYVAVAPPASSLSTNSCLSPPLGEATSALAARQLEQDLEQACTQFDNRATTRPTEMRW